MLEKMDEFFNRRVDGYEDHQLGIGLAHIFYPFTADQLPSDQNAVILDLGCGTGLELDYYFKKNPTAKVVWIDLAADMLDRLKQKFPDKQLELIQGSYFDIPFDNDHYDAVVSVESLHHFTQAEKIPLYRKVFDALKQGGYLILTDYFSSSDEEEQFFRKELLRLKKEQGISDNEFYHYDTPLTVEHETQALQEAGFSSVEVLGHWETTTSLKASKLSTTHPLKGVGL